MHFAQGECLASTFLDASVLQPASAVGYVGNVPLGEEGLNSAKVVNSFQTRIYDRLLASSLIGIVLNFYIPGRAVCVYYMYIISRVLADALEHNRGLEDLDLDYYTQYNGIGREGAISLATVIRFARMAP
jgi:hypothetical protein